MPYDGLVPARRVIPDGERDPGGDGRQSTRTPTGHQSPLRPISPRLVHGVAERPARRRGVSPTTDAAARRAEIPCRRWSRLDMAER